MSSPDTSPHPAAPVLTWRDGGQWTKRQLQEFQENPAQHEL
jgi:hypothetical protein